jgi:hypothetical protein
MFSKRARLCQCGDMPGALAVLPKVCTKPIVDEAAMCEDAFEEQNIDGKLQESNSVSPRHDGPSSQLSSCSAC